MTWTASVRAADLSLGGDILFESLELDENYNLPDRLAIDGQLDDIRAALGAGDGIVVTDDDGVQRFSGIAVDIERRGGNADDADNGTIVYASDLQRLWDRFCWPTPTAAWTAQTTAYDIQTAVAETRLLGYTLRNAGSSAFNGGGYDRRIAHLRLPTTVGRGPSATTSARFQNLGQLVADLAEAAGLRVTIVQTYTGLTPFLDVTLDAVPDISAWAQFGPAESGSPVILGEGWRYRIGPGATTVLSAAAGQLENRSLTVTHDATRQAAWGGRLIEFFIDQRGTTDAGEITEGRVTAMADNAGVAEVEAPLAESSLTMGVDIPVGAKVSAVLDGVLITERVRRITTKIPGDDGDDMTVTPVLGSPDGLLSPTQKTLAAAARRLRDLERSQ